MAYNLLENTLPSNKYSTKIYFHRFVVQQLEHNLHQRYDKSTENLISCNIFFCIQKNTLRSTKIFSYTNFLQSHLAEIKSRKAIQ